MTLKMAGQLYGSICQNAYPNVKAAIATAEANSFVLDQATGLHEHPKFAIHLRINSKVCSARFVARKGRDELPGAEFAESTAEMIKPGAKPGNPEIKSARLNSNTFDVAVVRSR
ncbi:hypothetical protein [Tritonibacter horizontis]|uniref:Uncharacterized protein n=1 Tax=Tritonibacter horizontis TaxID=1768241 RepID=A0A132C286_9RHOB|nr:hypothetical protein [Tritonibacter horizontis]KUP94362.1 hypothetical protein TRIHO_06810 [Tritonibacter horizontis]